MDHADAVALFLAERYVLGELDEEDAEAFEAHMFGCPICTEQVRLGFELLEETRERARRRPTPVIEARSQRRCFCRTFPRRRKPPKHRR